MNKEKIYFDPWTAEDAAKSQGFSVNGTSNIPNINLIPSDDRKRYIEEREFKYSTGTVIGRKLNPKGVELVQKRLTSPQQFEQGKLLFV